MEIDSKVIKALDSETRVNILKALIERRKMPAELSKELEFASSTAVGHLKILEEAGLVKGEKTAHKWKYYALTPKGRALIKPSIPMQFVLLLSIGVLIMFAGLFNLTDVVDVEYQYPVAYSRTVTADEFTTASSAGAPSQYETRIEESKDIVNETVYETGTVKTERVSLIGVLLLIVGSFIVSLTFFESITKPRR